MKNENDKCGNCYYYREPPPKKIVAPTPDLMNLGKPSCVRLPPTVLVLPGGNGGEVRIFSLYPPVEEHLYCGEHKEQGEWYEH